MDFDNKDPRKAVTPETILTRSQYYDLQPLFLYHSLRSTSDHPKFRAVFMIDIPIYDSRVAKAMQLAMGEIFSEADRSCYSDISKFYLGGKELIYYNESTPVIDIDTLFQSHYHCIKKNCGSKHYKEKLRRFSKQTGIALTPKGLLDVSKSDEPYEPAHLTEGSGAFTLSKNGGNSPNAIIMYNIKGHGEIPPFYRINFTDRERSTSNPSVGEFSTEKLSANHKPYRSNVIPEIRRNCKLFREFESGEKGLCHDELFGLMCSLINIETGVDMFISTLSKYPEFYDKLEKWKTDVQYSTMQNYYPRRCSEFCPYCGECNHGKNILSTAHLGRNQLEKDPDYQEYYYPIEEVQNDIYNAISRAHHASDNRVYVIKAQTGGGKSTSYLQIMEENDNERFLIPAPTNLLKDEIYNKSDRTGIDVSKTPSLEQIKNDIPPKVWKKIQWFYRRGQYGAVQPYINKILEANKIPCLEEYKEQREKVKMSKGNLITTHRYLMTMDEKRREEFDYIIIDEDLLLKSVFPNQGEVTLSNLSKLLKNTDDDRLRQKIRELLKLSKERSLIELTSFEYDYDKDNGVNDDKKSVPIDIPSFCAARYFCVRKVAKEKNLKEDTVVYIKPTNLAKGKYIIVSATADEEIYRKFFGADKVDFYECKQARYKGHLLQYPDRSMSRSSLDSDKDVVKRLRERFKLDEEHVITFKKENIGFLHFGNVEGSNALEGDDILVVGTPYHADFLYKLIAFSLGYDFDENEEMTKQIVVRNGYRFLINTYTDANLRKIHLWMMDSELEQSIGRARLLRHDCTVHLFSNLIMKQAEIVEGFNYSEEQSIPIENQ